MGPEGALPVMPEGQTTKEKALSRPGLDFAARCGAEVGEFFRTEVRSQIPLYRCLNITGKISTCVKFFNLSLAVGNVRG